MSRHDPALRCHLGEPDYSRPLLEIDARSRKRILRELGILYGREQAEAVYPEIEREMRVYHAHRTPEMLEDDRGFDPAERFTERDVILITYGDLLTEAGKPPLRTLADFAARFMRGAFNTLHILPFFPYSSDRGFSIIDYEDVDPRLGGWPEIEELGLRARLMFDGVFNHVSAKSRWFQRFLNGRPGYEDFFVAFSTREALDPDHLRLILRPRTSELLTPFRTINGTRWVWTTFSPDQVDLNFKNPRVLMFVVEILLYYVRRGADLVRLDAVTYIWRELGTRCAHLEQTHALVRLFRAILDVVAPRVALVTETNVPHRDNVSYFGNGANEAQLVYNFALPPLVLHSFQTGSCRRLREWARSLEFVSPSATYFNFLDSHDGIGLLGVQGILEPAEIDAMVRRVEEHGGLVSYRDNGDGTRSPYELNVTWYSALNREDAGEPLALQVQRFVASRSIPLALMGVPGVYVPSLFGSKNDIEAVKAGEGARAINRDAIDVPSLVRMLRDRETWVSKVARGFQRLVKRRIRLSCFHPNAAQRIVGDADAVFAVLRTCLRSGQRLLALTNVSGVAARIRLSPAELGEPVRRWRDALSGRWFASESGELAVELQAYEVLWLRAEDEWFVAEAGRAVDDPTGRPR